MTYCYRRKSTDKQDYDRQKKILEENGYINNKNCIYINESYTGKTRNRPALKQLINDLKENDTIVACDLSRISRSVKDFNELVEEVLKKKKANIIIIKENFSLRNNKELDAMTKLILNITASFAEFERDIISDRTKESLKAKKIDGTKSGKPIGHPRSKKADKNNFIKTLEYMVINNKGQVKATLKTGFPKDTFCRDIKKCYDKYNTKDYNIIIQMVQKELIWPL